MRAPHTTPTERSHRPTPTGQATRPPVVLLVQGGIASGKSTVTGLLVRQGATHLDCDRIAHEELDQPEVADALRARFGPGVFDPAGKVSRPALGAVVFSDPEALRSLEALVHPRVRERVQEALARERRPQGEPRAVVVIDAAVASKMRLAGRYDLVLFVKASDEVRRRRALGRGWAEGELERREAQQRPLDQAEREADAVVRNDGDLQETETHVQRFWSERVQPLR